VKAALAPFKIVLTPAYNAEKMKASMAKRKAEKAAAAAHVAGAVAQGKVAKPFPFKK